MKVAGARVGSDSILAVEMEMKMKSVQRTRFKMNDEYLLYQRGLNGYRNPAVSEAQLTLMTRVLTRHQHGDLPRYWSDLPASVHYRVTCKNQNLTNSDVRLQG